MRLVVAIYSAIMLKDKALFEIVYMRRDTKILRGDDDKPVPNVSGGPVLSRAWACTPGLFNSQGNDGESKT